MRNFHYWILGCVLLAALLPLPALAQTPLPPVWDIVSDDFESGSLADWTLGGVKTISLTATSGYSASTGLSVPIGQETNYLLRSRFAKAREGYLTFRFNPNHATIPDPDTTWLPANSIYVASIASSQSWWPPLVTLYVRHETGVGYKGFLAWPRGAELYYDTEHEFDIASDWQHISLGYRIDEWVGIWIDGELISDGYPSNRDAYGDVITLGKGNENTTITPSGALHFDDVVFQMPRVAHLWVDAAHGSDENDGLTASTPLQTIQRAADQAGPGAIVHILPGVYRETVWPLLNGTATEPVVYRAENGPGTVVLRGSEPTSALTWTQLLTSTIIMPGVDPTNLYYADLSAWGLEAAPRFVVELDNDGEIAARLPVAREPDWPVTTAWKAHEFWWAADGGSAPAPCVPSPTDPDCDIETRATTRLTDRTDDATPAGIEAGNLTTLRNLTGGTLVTLDTSQGHIVCRRAIVAHNREAGRVTLNEPCGTTTNPGLGWGSKYYVENHLALLDTPGEWWYDAATGRLYLWPRVPGDPATQAIEISRRNHGFNLKNRSYITLDGLTIEILDGAAVYLANWEKEHAYGNVVQNVALRYANWGAYVTQSTSALSRPGDMIEGFVLEKSEIAYMDGPAVRLIHWWAPDGLVADFTRPGIRHTTIRDNELHHLGFNADGDNAVGLSFTHAHQLRLERNHVHDVARHGIQFLQSVIQSDNYYGFTPDEIKTGEILIKDNVVEHVCQLTANCGGLKFWGTPPDNHVFRDVLIMGNVIRNNIGWAYVSEQRGRWSGGAGSQVQGMGAFGVYVEQASGLHAYRNLVYNNAQAGFGFAGVWRDGQIIYSNNVAANSLYGFVLRGEYDTHGSHDTQVLNNILINHELFGISLHYAGGNTANMRIDHNLYHSNGWGPQTNGGLMTIRVDGATNSYDTLAALQAATLWEDHGMAADPAFYDYDLADHDLFAGDWPDFYLTPGSTAAIDHGTPALPASLVALLDAFDVPDAIWGPAVDIGRYEAGFALIATPPTQTLPVGGTAYVTVGLYPPDLPHTVTLTLDDAPAGFSGALGAHVLAATETITLTVTHDGSLTGWGTWQTFSITGDSRGFTATVTAALLLEIERVYLPLVLRQ